MYRYTFGRLYTADQAVFVDESSFDRWTEIRGRTWALSGKAAVRKAFFIRGKQCISLAFTDHIRVHQGLPLRGLILSGGFEGFVNCEADVTDNASQLQRGL